MSDKPERRTRRKASEESNQSDLTEVVLDAGTVDLSPTTSSVKVVTQSTAIVPGGGALETDSLATAQAGYSRTDSLRGDSFEQPEPAAMLTADRLIDVSAKNRPAPESGFRRFLYFLSFKTLNLGDSLKIRERKAIDARIGAVLEG